MIEVDEDILVCAVRYALGRHTYIVKEVTDTVYQNAKNLSKKTICNICKDIIKLLEQEAEIAPTNQIGMNSIDSEEWYKLLVSLYLDLDEESRKYVKDNTDDDMLRIDLELSNITKDGENE